MVGVANDDPAGGAGDFDGVPDGVWAGNLGAGDCAARLATATNVANVACKDREITIRRW